MHVQQEAEKRIVLKDVYKSYQLGEKSISILKGINLSLPSRQTITLMGPSGSGKSTLMNLLSGIDRPDSGELLINGLALQNLSEKEITLFRRRKIGIIFQFFNLLNYLNCLENVSLPLYLAGWKKKQAWERSREVLYQVGLEARYQHRPEELSGGEQQRVAIARAIANEPELLLADEPTGNLDTKNSQKIIELLYNLQEKSNFGILLVTHNPEIADAGDHKLNMLDGNLS
ncbi:MAG: ABC transporter ATP-binding protein [Spirochaetota bacterium]